MALLPSIAGAAASATAAAPPAVVQLPLHALQARCDDLGALGGVGDLAMALVRGLGGLVRPPDDASRPTTEHAAGLQLGQGSTTSQRTDARHVDGQCVPRSHCPYAFKAAPLEVRCDVLRSSRAFITPSAEELEFAFCVKPHAPVPLVCIESRVRPSWGRLSRRNKPQDHRRSRTTGCFNLRPLMKEGGRCEDQILHVVVREVSIRARR